MPLAEHDVPGDIGVFTCCVSIHVPLAEHDPSAWRPLFSSTFQFTCPSRSTTHETPDDVRVAVVSIHVPLAEHDDAPLVASYIMNVSIHVPLAEHDI